MLFIASSFLVYIVYYVFALPELLVFLVFCFLLFFCPHSVFFSNARTLSAVFKLEKKNLYVPTYLTNKTDFDM